MKISILKTALLTTIFATSVNAEIPAKVGATEGKLNIISRQGFFERGKTDRRYDWVTNFEKQTGCLVNYKTADSPSDILALINTGKYDLVTVSGDAGLQYILDGKIQEININLIPSWLKIDSVFQNSAVHTVDGKHYGVPYVWGPNLLMYNNLIFKTPPKSWSVVFEAMNLPDGRPNKGRIQAFNRAISIGDAALYLMKKDSSLGIKNPYELNEIQYATALKVLRKQKALVHSYWADMSAQMTAFRKNEVVASMSWSNQANTLKFEKRPISWTIPEEGATGWSDTTMLLSKASNPNCAYKWMEHSITDSVQAALSEWNGVNPTVTEACKAKAPEGTDFCSDNGFSTLSKIIFYRTPREKCIYPGGCVPYGRWITDFNNIANGK